MEHHELPQIVPVASIFPGEDERRVEREEILRVWKSGCPLQNIQGIRRASPKWKINNQDADVQQVQWTRQRAKAIIQSDYSAIIDGGEAMHLEIRNLSLRQSAEYLGNKLDWTSDSLMERMYRRLKTERNRDWTETDIIDELGLPYPPYVYLGGGDEKLLLPDDFDWSSKFSECLALYNMWLSQHYEIESAIRGSRNHRRLWHKDMEELYCDFDDCLANLKKRLPDPRFVMLERFRPIIQPNETVMKSYRDALAEADPEQLERIEMACAQRRPKNMTMETFARRFGERLRAI